MAIDARQCRRDGLNNCAGHARVLPASFAGCFLSIHVGHHGNELWWTTHGVDVSIPAETKYIFGHSDRVIGIITARTSATWLCAACATMWDWRM